MKLEEYLLLLLLQAGPMRLLGEQDGWLLLTLQKDELKRPRQALVERLEVSPGEFESTQGWHVSMRARRWSERQEPLYVSSSQLRLYRQPQKMLM